jgi:hypothetical protein
MPYFAKIVSTNNSNLFTVVEVLAIEQSVVDEGHWGDPTMFIQTSYNTRGGIHYAPSPPNEPNTPDGGVALRANFAYIGCVYDLANDVFYAPQPYPSWTISAPTWIWQPPIPQPPYVKGYYWIWDESTLSWIQVPR